MRGRRKGRPAKWSSASISELICVGKAGLTFEVREKWNRTRWKLGALRVGVGRLRRRPLKAENYRRRSWREFAEWLRGR